MLFTERPANFDPDAMEVVTCAILHLGRVLILKRHPIKPHGGKWCLPGGKRDSGSIDEEGLRELLEETGIAYRPEGIRERKLWYIKYPEGDFVYNQLVFRPELRPEVRLLRRRPEHTAHDWVNWQELLLLPFIEDLDGVLAHLLK